MGDDSSVSDGIHSEGDTLTSLVQGGASGGHSGSADIGADSGSGSGGSYSSSDGGGVSRVSHEKKKKGCKQACKAVWKLGCYRASVAKKSEVYCIFIVNTQIINHNFVLRLLKIMAQKMSDLHVFEDCQTLMPFSDFCCCCCCCRGVWLLFYEQHLICYKRTVIHDTEIMMHIRFTLKF